MRQEVRDEGGREGEGMMRKQGHRDPERKKGKRARWEGASQPQEPA